MKGITTMTQQKNLKENDPLVLVAQLVKMVGIEKTVQRGTAEDTTILTEEALAPHPTMRPTLVHLQTKLKLPAVIDSPNVKRIYRDVNET